MKIDSLNAGTAVDTENKPISLAEGVKADDTMAFTHLLAHGLADLKKNEGSKSKITLFPCPVKRYPQKKFGTSFRGFILAGYVNKGSASVV